MNDDTTWRVGRHNPRNLYIGNQHVAVTVGADEQARDLAERIAAAMNHTESGHCPHIWRQP